MQVILELRCLSAQPGGGAWAGAGLVEVIRTCAGELNRLLARPGLRRREADSGRRRRAEIGGGGGALAGDWKLCSATAQARLFFSRYILEYVLII